MPLCRRREMPDREFVHFRDGRPPCRPTLQRGRTGGRADFRAGRSKEPRIFRHFQVEPADVKPVKILTVVNAVPISIRGD